MPAHPYAKVGREIEHRAIAARVLGRPLPRGAEVHHFDEDKLNNAPSNLVICPSKAYHRLLHVRQRALRECGNANYKKCRFCKSYDDPSNMVAWGGNSHCHKTCSYAYYRSAYKRKRSCQPHAST